ncbi:hypothetical protein SAMN05216215_101887 [Saccharopolyspora shandongensis]|uniref:Uncharacterized protein n=1 Tax=Saccharopolyspora shandongensis TaxID=418495 RepID=A0A1H3G8F3_9PSEU|nr:hypothetical protein [Saccharopolyspora shandongensis]SDX99602.1 hypothetical protein SAMN05216215_101887 [Saccharopolyspora shandongensis]
MASLVAARGATLARAMGITLLHIERARTGCGPWQRAQDWLAEAVRQG